MKYYIVWNESNTEGFVTFDEQLAYEVRKSAYSNCFDINGRFHPVAKTFCEEWGYQNCTIEIIN